ncbi:hypothetical protein PR202_gn00897 [Eleusine coracana subsp. coracana]|uniref:Uncharacterized protein n=1 Tax=Eleusine coracana subsp. coracana TaxID=191504 RepID=A0AAV5G4I0_ELECO|nr:hypothetical protein PR202_gn00897 [Eleusine coracana subsp. coracana]
MGSNDGSRGSIAFFATYRPPVPLDIFSCPVPPSSRQDELQLTDGVSSNYNGQAIPAAALKALLKRPKVMAAVNSEFGADDVDGGRVSGLVFRVLSLGEVFSGGGDFSGVRLEDGGCVSATADPSVVYVSTKEPVEARRSPWTVVYKTSLKTGKTERLTPRAQFDLSPAVSPSGKRVAVASFPGNSWGGEIEDLKTDIFVMNVDRKKQGGLGRRLVVKNGGWPSWGGEDALFFHRKVGDFWGVFRVDVNTKETVRVTPDNLDAVTPAAVSETKVAVATIRQKSKFSDVRVEAQYRHIEIFDVMNPCNVEQVTRMTRPKADHYNPFVIPRPSSNGKPSTVIGYHRCVLDDINSNEMDPYNKVQRRNFHTVQSPHKDVGLFRVSGGFPTISNDGKRLAFVDNEFKAVWVADKAGLRIVYETKGPDSVFSPMWNQNPAKDVLYVCMGPSFNAGKPLEICAIPNVSGRARQRRQLTRGGFNNAFPSSSPDGTKLVFRSTRDGGDKRHKNLYLMDRADVGEYGDGTVTRLTNGPWTDTHCQWAPNGDWIVFSSTRDKPQSGVPELDNGLDPGYFAVYLMSASDPDGGCQSPPQRRRPRRTRQPPGVQPRRTKHRRHGGPRRRLRRPISLPLFLHSVRPYGDVFAVDLVDTDDVTKNKDIAKFHRITHSRYENSTPAWTMYSTDDPNAQWNMLVLDSDAAAAKYRPACPYAYPDGGEGWHMTGHLIIPKRCC